MSCFGFSNHPAIMVHKYLIKYTKPAYLIQFYKTHSARVLISFSSKFIYCEIQKKLLRGAV